MNRYEEAFEELKEVLYLPDKYLEKRLNILQELVEKATPKKPIPLNWDMNRCPNCKCYLPTKRNALKKREPRIYCDRCGQALDWSEEECKD